MCVGNDLREMERSDNIALTSSFIVSNLIEGKVAVPAFFKVRFMLSCKLLLHLSSFFLILKVVMVLLFLTHPPAPAPNNPMN